MKLQGLWRSCYAKIFPKPRILREEVDYATLEKKRAEWALVELNYWAMHLTKATEMLVKQTSFFLYDHLEIREVALLEAIAKYSKLAQEGECVGEPVRLLLKSNHEDVESIQQKLKPHLNHVMVVWEFLAELESFQVCINKTEELCRTLKTTAH